MIYKLATIFSFSIGIGAIIGLVRFKKINPAYYPFIYCVWIAFFNEILGYVIIRNHGSNAINNNIYALAESLLIVWFFKKLNLFRNREYLFPLTLSVFFLAWLSEIIFGIGIQHTVSYYRVFYAFIIVLMSGAILNIQLMKERKNFLKNSIFIIGMSFLIYFTYRIITIIFILYVPNLNTPFAVNLFTIFIYVNLFINLVYALAILWMPTKHRFSLPS